MGAFHPGEMGVSRGDAVRERTGGLYENAGTHVEGDFGGETLDPSPSRSKVPMKRRLDF